MNSNTDYRAILEEIYQEIMPLAKEGKQADYIPALAKVNPDQFGMCLETVDGKVYDFMQADTRFSIQSISKVFSLAMCLSLKGEDLWQRVRREPSGNAFNSIVLLEAEKGKPRNPFINAGAIVLADVIISAHRMDYEEKFINFIRALSDCDTIDYRLEVAYSERETGYMNAAIANLLKHHGRIENNIEEVLMFYFKMCSIEMSCRELSKAFVAFTNSITFDFAGYKLTPSQIKRLNAVMQTCGFYDEAGDFSYLVGLPGKSGVGGGIVAIYPMRYAVAVWSPRLNSKGNSVMGMKALELLTSATHESIF